MFGLDDPSTGSQGLDALDELLEGDVLEKVATSAEAQRLEGRVVVIEGGEDEHWWEVDTPHASDPQHLQSTHPRHPQVQQDDLGVVFFNGGKPRLPVVGLGDDGDV